MSAMAAFGYLSGSPQSVEGFAHVGYPQQLRIILGIAKPLDAIANVGVIEAGNRFCFSLKPLLGGGVGGDISGQNFDGDDSVESAVVGAIDFAHSTRSERSEDFVRT
jgi:hypothetical protein